MKSAPSEEPAPVLEIRLPWIPEATPTDRRPGPNARGAARVAVAAAVLARSIDELATPIARRLLEEMGQSPDSLERSLEQRQSELRDLDDFLELRCTSL